MEVEQFNQDYAHTFKEILMKATLFTAAALAAALLFAGCSTIIPMQGNNVLATDNFEVLGRITIHSESHEAGFIALMDEAKRQYPEADDIINILVDGKKSFFSTEYIMSAVVIKYTSPATAQ